MRSISYLKVFNWLDEGYTHTLGSIICFTQGLLIFKNCFLKMSETFFFFFEVELINNVLVSGIQQRRQWQPTPVLLPGKSHGWRSLVGCSPWGHQESDTTEHLHFHFSLSCIGEGNGNPLQCSWLENPRDGGAWWAAIYGVAQSRTRLKRLSSSIQQNDSVIYTHVSIVFQIIFPFRLSQCIEQDSLY